MDLKEKAALTTLSLNTLLTILKFVLFAFSGSLVVLAEAWHSFSDIATSFLVYVAMLRKRRKKEKNDGKEEEEEKAPESGARPKVNFEQAVSIGIGVFLLVVALMLMWKFFFFTPAPVKNPLLAGLIFLGFSLGSYAVYRFETTVGRQTGSVGLMSDGMHAKIDMAASLIAGFSLILYHLGFDLDVWVAGFIALIVLAFSIETLVNVVISIVRKESKVVFQYKYYTIIFKALTPRRLVVAGEFLDKHLRIRFFGTALMKKAPLYLMVIAVLGSIGWWISTAVFKVGPSEQAFVERFGRPLNPESPLGPGMHTKAPWPVDRAVIADTESVRRLNMGNMPDANTFALLWTQRHGEEIPFLSGDNNYFYPYLVVHYKVKNLYDYLYENHDPVELAQDIAIQILNKFFATRTFTEIVLDSREYMMVDLGRKLQTRLDELKTGIEIVTVAVKDIHPPIIIADSYEMVIASIQEKEMMINDALGYKNQNIPETRGDAIRLRKDAEGYAFEMPVKARGDAEMFLLQLPENEEIKRLTRTRLYLSAMAEALLGRSKILVDPEAGVPELWLNARDLMGMPGSDFNRGRF